MTQAESIDTAIKVLRKLSWLLVEAGELDDIPTITRLTTLLASMRDVAIENPNEFREFAVGTEPPTTSEN